MHLDNSACNLASHQPAQVPRRARRVRRARLSPRRRRDDHGAGHPGRQLVVSDRGDRAATRSDFRELGLGYANLGALLMALGLPYDSDQGRNYAGAITALMTGEAYLQSARIAAGDGPVLRLCDQPRADAQGHRAPSRDRPTSSNPRTCRSTCCAPRARPGTRRCKSRPERGLSQLAGDRDRAHRHHRLHDGLRHHRHRARHRAGQVQEAGRRRDAQNRQRDRAARAQAASATIRARSRKSSSTSTSTTPSRARRIWPTRICRCSIALSSRAPARARSTTRAICKHDGRGAAVHLGRDFQDHQHAGRSRRRGRRRGLHDGVEAGAEGGRDLSRRLQAHPAAQHRQGQGREPRRPRQIKALAAAAERAAQSRASCPTSANRSRTSSISPATRATSPSACTRTASRARFSSACPSRARPSRA